MSCSSRTTNSLSPWWWLGVAVLFPLVYVLSVPALLWCVDLKVHPLDLKYHKKAPQWVKTYCDPYIRALSSKSPLLQKPLNNYATLWGYQRNPVILRAEAAKLRFQQMQAQWEERLKESQARSEELRQRIESYRRQLPKARPPTLPLPNTDTHAEPELRGYESLLRKSS